jgi:hypothetical protein
MRIHSSENGKGLVGEQESGVRTRDPKKGRPSDRLLRFTQTWRPHSHGGHGGKEMRFGS